MGERKPTNEGPVKNRPAVKSWSDYVPRARAKVMQCFLDADLRYMIPGLVALCERNGIKPQERQRGELVVFINAARDFIKVLAFNGTRAPILACYRVPRGRIYDLRVIGEIPAAFKANGQVDFDLALENVLKKHLDRKRKNALDVVSAAKNANSK